MGCLRVVSVVACLVFAGCYGSTEPATDVGPLSAQLNGRGTMNDGPGYSFFQWRAAGTSEWTKTDEVRLPAGASGPFRAELRRSPTAFASLRP